MLHKKAVTAETLALIKRLMADTRLNDFTLVGGTALALIIGHRQSIDIDLFTVRPFDVPDIAAILEEGYKATFIKASQGSLQCFIDGVKTDLIAHPYRTLKPVETVEGVRPSSLPDIAAMKLHAIVNDGSRIKDFVDIHFMLEKMTMLEMCAAYEEKYYPNTSRDVVKRALRDHSRIDFKEPVMLLDSAWDWSKIDSRLLAAIERPDKLFIPPSKEQRSAKPELPPPAEQRKRGRRL